MYILSAPRWQALTIMSTPGNIGRKYGIRIAEVFKKSEFQGFDCLTNLVEATNKMPKSKDNSEVSNSMKAIDSRGLSS
jgi:hypothetical protein